MNGMRDKVFTTSRNQTLIHHFLEKSAESLPDKIALIHEDIRVSYSQINDQANCLAQHLLQKGIVRGDRIALLMENSLGYVVSYYGSLKTGGVVVPLNSDLKPEGLNTILHEIEPKTIISSYKFEKLLQATNLSENHIQELILKTPRQKWSSSLFSVTKFEELLQVGPTSNPEVQTHDTDLASIIYTSGSTGPPKGAMLTHKNIVSNILSICQYLRLTQDDIQMVVLPFYYVMGKSLLNTHFAVGGTVVINNKLAFPVLVLNQMVTERVTGFSGVPSTYAYLLHRSPLANYRDKLTALRYCSQAGGHMWRAIKAELRQVLPHHTEIYIMYGATEASARLSYLEPEELFERMDSIGRAIPGVRLQILGENGNELPVGEVGELVASGPNIMQGYWKDPEATAKVLDKNGYHTGDLALQDADGYFYIVGRKDHLLKVGGHRVNPVEIEDVLMDSGLLMESVVFGIPDEILGHKLVALAVGKTENCYEGDILRYCASRLPKYKIPSCVKFVKDLPRSTSGKADRTRCLELFGKYVIKNTP